MQTFPAAFVVMIIQQAGSSSPAKSWGFEYRFRIPEGRATSTNAQPPIFRPEIKLDFRTDRGACLGQK
jgi:hypothetical protein